MSDSAQPTAAQRLRILAWAMLAAAVIMVGAGIGLAAVWRDGETPILPIFLFMALIDVGLFVWLRRKAARHDS